MLHRPHVLALLIAASLAAPVASFAQSRKLRVIAADSQPIVYAFVSIGGGTGQITDDKGEINLGIVKSSTLNATVRRIGFQPWGGKLSFSDDEPIVVVTMTRVAQSLAGVSVNANRSGLSLTMQGFYDRWQMRQKGLLTATFIGPEEIDFRHPDKITNMLSGLNGVSFRRTNEGDLVAFGYNGQCPMAILVDGIRLCPSNGCKCPNCDPNVVSIGRATKVIPALGDSVAVLIDRAIDAASVSAIEVYARGANMPISLQVSDAACGAIAFWTGSRHP